MVRRLLAQNEWICGRRCTLCGGYFSGKGEMKFMKLPSKRIHKQSPTLMTMKAVLLLLPLLPLPSTTVATAVDNQSKSTRQAFCSLVHSFRWTCKSTCSPSIRIRALLHFQNCNTFSPCRFNDKMSRPNEFQLAALVCCFHTVCCQIFLALSFVWKLFHFFRHRIAASSKTIGWLATRHVKWPCKCMQACILIERRVHVIRVRRFRVWNTVSKLLYSGAPVSLDPLLLCRAKIDGGQSFGKWNWVESRVVFTFFAAPRACTRQYHVWIWQKAPSTEFSTPFLLYVFMLLFNRIPFCCSFCSWCKRTLHSMNS